RELVEQDGERNEWQHHRRRVAECCGAYQCYPDGRQRRGRGGEPDRGKGRRPGRERGVGPRGCGGGGGGRGRTGGRGGVLAVWVVPVVRRPTRSRARSVTRWVVIPRRPVGRAPLPADPTNRGLVRRPRWVAISERVILRVVPRSPRVVPPALVPVAVQVLPAARAVPARAELGGPRAAGRGGSTTVGTRVRCRR